MPILNVKISAEKSPAMTARIADMLLELTTRILHKDPQVTAIAIDYVDPARLDRRRHFSGRAGQEQRVFRHQDHR